MAALICSLPCRLCDQGCKIFSSTCKCGCTLCEGGVKTIAKSCRSPFCFFGTIATILNLPPIAAALSIVPAAMTGYGATIGGCQGLMWMTVNAILCLINIIAAWYFAATVVSRNGDDPDMPKRAFERATRMLCYDPWIALYLVVGVGFIVWQGYGSAQFTLYTTGATSSDGYCPSGLSQAWSTSLAFSWAYIFTGGLALCIGFCCASCDKTDYSKEPTQFYVTPAQQRNGHIPSVMNEQPQQQDIETGNNKKKSKVSSLFSSAKSGGGGGEGHDRSSAQAEIPIAEAVVIGPAVATAATATATAASAPTKQDIQQSVTATATATGNNNESGGGTSSSNNNLMNSATKAADSARKSVMKQIGKMKQARVD